MLYSLSEALKEDKQYGIVLLVSFADVAWTLVADGADWVLLATTLDVASYPWVSALGATKNTKSDNFINNPWISSPIYAKIITLASLIRVIILKAYAAMLRTSNPKRGRSKTGTPQPTNML